MIFNINIKPLKVVFLYIFTGWGIEGKHMISGKMLLKYYDFFLIYVNDMGLYVT